MVNIGFAAAPELAFMGLGAEQVSAVDIRDSLFIEISPEDRAQVTDKKPRLFRG